MNADFTALDQLRLHHPAWKLLRSDHAPLLISFLHQSFIAPNVRVIAQSALVAALDDTLYALHSHYQAHDQHLSI